MTKKIKVCYVLCYKDPNYTRTNSLINALKKIDNVELTVIKNKNKGVLRYFEVPPKLLLTRLRVKPDVFVVGFRAHEIFWAFYPSMIGKKIVFDEFIDHHEWILEEHHKFGMFGGVLVDILDAYMRVVMFLSKYVLTDTEAHAKLCVKNYKVPEGKVKDIPVGADEGLFYPRKKPLSKKFNVLFYGSMLPLHGTDYILESLEILAKRDSLGDLQITFVGGKGEKSFVDKLESLKKRTKLSSRINYIPWVEYEKLPALINTQQLCLGGPFGNTEQAKKVITGKTYQLLAMAMPVVVGRINTMTGFKNKKNCLIVDQASGAALADTLEWAMKNKNQLSSIGSAGRKLYEKQFSSVVISKKLKALEGLR